MKDFFSDLICRYNNRDNNQFKMDKKRHITFNTLLKINKISVS